MEVFQNISLLHKKSVGLFRGCITRAPDCIEYAESGANFCAAETKFVQKKKEL